MRRAMRSADQVTEVATLYHAISCQDRMGAGMPVRSCRGSFQHPNTNDAASRFCFAVAGFSEGATLCLMQLARNRMVLA